MIDYGCGALVRKRTLVNCDPRPHAFARERGRTRTQGMNFETCFENVLSWPSAASALTAKYQVPVASPSMPTVVSDGLGSDSVREYWPDV